MRLFETAGGAVDGQSSVDVTTGASPGSGGTKWGRIDICQSGGFCGHRLGLCMHIHAILIIWNIPNRGRQYGEDTFNVTKLITLCKLSALSLLGTFLCRVVHHQKQLHVPFSICIHTYYTQQHTHPSYP